MFRGKVTASERDSHTSQSNQCGRVAQVCVRIAEMVAGEACGPPISATAIAEALNIPLTIASQHLTMAESKGVLCRDDGPEGLRFYRNFFEEVAC